MRKLKRKVPRLQKRRHNAHRHFMIDVDEFDFIDDDDELFQEWMIATDGIAK